MPNLFAGRKAMEFYMDFYVYIGLGILFILFIVVLVMTISTRSKLNELDDYAEDGDLAETLKTYYQKISDLKVMIHDSSDKALEGRIAACEKQIGSSISKIYVENFDAFDDVTGRLSFAAALLDSTNSGIILTSLYGHSSSNTYIRYVVNGVTSVKLTEEEMTALEKAMAGEKKVLSSGE